MCMFDRPWSLVLVGWAAAPTTGTHGIKSSLHLISPMIICPSLFSATSRCLSQILPDCLSTLSIMSAPNRRPFSSSQPLIVPTRRQSISNEAYFAQIHGHPEHYSAGPVNETYDTGHGLSFRSTTSMSHVRAPQLLEPVRESYGIRRNATFNSATGVSLFHALQVHGPINESYDIQQLPSIRSVFAPSPIQQPQFHHRLGHDSYRLDDYSTLGHTIPAHSDDNTTRFSRSGSFDYFAPDANHQIPRYAPIPLHVGQGAVNHLAPIANHHIPCYAPNRQVLQYDPMTSDLGERTVEYHAPTANHHISEHSSTISHNDEIAQTRSRSMYDQERRSAYSAHTPHLVLQSPSQYGNQSIGPTSCSDTKTCC